MPRRVDVPDLGLLFHKRAHQALALVVAEDHDLDAALLEVGLAAHEAGVFADHDAGELVPGEGGVVRRDGKRKGDVGYGSDRYVQDTCARAHVAGREGRVHGRAGVGGGGETAGGFEGGDLGLCMGRVSEAGYRRMRRRGRRGRRRRRRKRARSRREAGDKESVVE